MRMSNIINRIISFRGDKVIWFIIAILFGVSLLTVYSATGTIAFLKTQNTAYFLLKRGILIAVCTFAMIFVSKIHYKKFSTYSGLILFIGWLAVLLLPVIGVEVNGSRRWIRIPIIGMTVQPSEIVKIGLIMYTSRVLSLYQESKELLDKAFKHIMIVSGIVLIVVFLQDFSTTALIGLTVLVLCFIGRVRLKLVGTVIGGLLMGLVLLIVISNYVQIPGRIGTIQNRVLSHLGINSNEDSNEIYENQIVQSKIAIATGGYTGKGPGNSIQRNFLPLPYSDFIYAVIVEEDGLIVGIIVILLYLILMYRTGKMVYISKKVFPALLVIGLSLCIVLQAMVNILVAVGLMPITGQPLPLVSMGGSSLLFTCISLGMIQSVSHTLKQETEVVEEIEQENK